MMKAYVLDTLALSLTYPRPGSVRWMRDGAARVRAAGDSQGHQRLAEALDGLAAWLAAAAPGEAEERYTILFDLSPVCTLNLGYHLFGESYQRGALLAGLSGELRQAGLDAGDEIPDHMTLVLRLLARQEDAENRLLLLREILLPGLVKINEKLEGASHPWRELLAAAAAILTEMAEFESSRVTISATLPLRLPVLNRTSADQDRVTHA